jgi:hypothetical protein
LIVTETERKTRRRRRRRRRRRQRKYSSTVPKRIQQDNWIKD